MIGSTAPHRASATAKNTANTTDRRDFILANRVAIGSGIQMGQEFLDRQGGYRQAGRLRLSGSVPWKLAPGCGKLPSLSRAAARQKEALTNQPMVVAKIRRAWSPEPILGDAAPAWQIPAAAMIILISAETAVAIRSYVPAISTRCRADS